MTIKIKNIQISSFLYLHINRCFTFWVFLFTWDYYCAIVQSFSSWGTEVVIFVRQQYAKLFVFLEGKCGCLISEVFSEVSVCGRTCLIRVCTVTCFRGVVLDVFCGAGDCTVWKFTVFFIQEENLRIIWEDLCVREENSAKIWSETNRSTLYSRTEYIYVDLYLLM